MSPTELAFVALLVLSCGLAIARGGNSARTVGLILAGAALLTWIVPESAHIRYAHVSLTLFAIDFGAWLALLWVVKRSASFWTIWVASLQGMTVLAHLARFSGPTIGVWVYYLGISAWSWLMQAILLSAAIADMRRGTSGTSAYSPGFWRTAEPPTQAD